VLLQLQLVGLFLFFATTCSGSECNGESKPGPPNLEPVSSKMTFQKSISNAKLYIAGEGEDSIDVVHLWGTPYQMGFAHGTLMKDKLNAFYPQVYSYLEEQVFQKAANNTVFKWIAQVGVDVALDLSYERTKSFVQSYVEQEIQGIADALGKGVREVRRVMWIGELTRGSCSMFGAWGEATRSIGGSLLQLRALDWDTTGPFRNYHQITIYHPEPQSGQGHAWLNLGFAGWTASITGMSSVELGMSEIGVSFPDKSFGKETYLAKGYPFGFLIRDILQFDTTLEDGLARITNATRTCDLLLGIGDGKANKFKGVQYSPEVANVYDDTDLQPLNETWHPRIPDVVYWGMDWICPNDNLMLSHQLLAYHGNLTAQNTITNITSYVQTGDLHIAIYDFARMVMYVATARSDGERGPLNAYQRAFVELNMTQVFAEAKPTPAPTTP